MENNDQTSQNPPQNSNDVQYIRLEGSSEPRWWERFRTNKPQSNSAGAAALVFVSGGMNIAWGVGFSSPLLLPITTHMQICWFIAAIAGAIIGATVCNYLQKKFIYLYSALLVAISGILFISLSTEPKAIITARYIDGFANGLVLVPTLVMVAEEAVKSFRGMLASSIEVMCFSIGLHMQITYVTNWDNNNAQINVHQMQGILSMLFGIISFVIAYFFVIESPIFYLSRGQEDQALDALRRLQRPFIVTTETYEQFEEHKRYIDVNKEMSLRESAVDGLPALLKLCFYRGMVAASFSFLLTTALVSSSLVSYGIFADWPFVVYGTLRWLSVLLTTFLLDTVGRKIPMLLGAVVCGGIIIGVGVIFNDPSNILDGSKMKAALYLLFIFQLFAGVYISSSSAYLCEAFPLAIKPFYIAIAFSIEMLVQIIIISCDKAYHSVPDFCFTIGVLMIVFFYFAIFYLPETKLLTLREAQEKFRNFRLTRILPQ